MATPSPCRLPAFLYRSWYHGLLVAVGIILGVSVLPTPAAGQVGDCHDCEIENPETGCVQCILYTEIGFTYCNQPSCNNCNLGSWCQPTLAQMLFQLPKDDALAVLVHKIALIHRAGSSAPGFASRSSPTWSVGMLRRVLADVGLYVTGDNEIVTCQGEVFGSVAELAEYERDSSRSLSTLNRTAG
jgi:hypothetical protein